MPESCPCGATRLLKFSAVKKRLETIIVLNNGDELYPTVFDETLYSISGLVDYQVIVTKQNDLERLKFKIELREESNDSILEIQKKLLAAPLIAKSLSSGSMVAPQIEILSPGALKAVSRAKKLILDQR